MTWHILRLFTSAVLMLPYVLPVCIPDEVYDAELDKLYTPSKWAFDPTHVFQNHVDIVTRGSFEARRDVPNRLNIPYGSTEAQKLDIFGEADLPEDAPVFVFVHGGYWSVGSRNISSFLVKPFHSAGIISVIVGYDLVSDTNSVTLSDIVSEIRSALNFIMKYAQPRKSRGVYLCGHSAGAHLIMMALSSQLDQTQLSNIIKGVIPVSGVYDLLPLLHTSISCSARITKAVADSESPSSAVTNLKKNLYPSTKVAVVVADHDSPTFISQSKNYTEELKKEEIDADFLLVENEDHFTVIEKLRFSDSHLTKKIMELIKKTSSAGDV